MDGRDKTEAVLAFIKIVTHGNRDTVHLRHNNLRIFSVVCYQRKKSDLKINPRFYSYSDLQWDKAIKEYCHYKKSVMPNFKLPIHSGRRKDGQTHPWRKIARQKSAE